MITTSIQTRVRRETGPSASPEVDAQTTYKLFGGANEQFAVGEMMYRNLRVEEGTGLINLLEAFGIQDPSRVSFLHVASQPAVNCGAYGYRFTAVVNGVVLGTFGQFTLADAGDGIPEFAVTPDYQKDRTHPAFNLLIVIGLK